jgi:tetratricopeptide (TPR) repeat protein
VYNVDFFVSRRGSSATVAQEIADVLLGEGYSVRFQDWDILVGDDFIEAMHEMLTHCRHLIAVLSKDYLNAPFTKLEWTNFLAAAMQSNGSRRLIPVRVEDVTPAGLFASRVYADLVGVDDPTRRRDIILNAATGRTVPKAKEPQIVRGVPPPNPSFTGRRKLIDELHQTLMAADRPAAITQVVIYGLGGIGKTALATEYVHKYYKHYGGVWWASAESRAVLIESLAELGATLDERRYGSHDTKGYFDDRPAEELAKATLTKLGESATPWLLVYDNLKTSEVIRDLVPSTNARILITTRLTTLRGKALPVELDVLTRKEAVELLLKLTGRKNRKGASLLADALGRLPLALDQAAAYVSLTGLSFKTYADRAGDLITRAPKGYPESVSATFKIAIDQATGECPAAEKILAFLSVLAPDQIPLDLINDRFIKENERDDALMALRNVSLVKYETDSDGNQAMFVHRAVRAAMSANVKAANKTSEVITSAITKLAKAYPDVGYSDPSCWPRCKQLLPHGLTLREEAAIAKVETTELAELLDGMANYLLGRSVFAGAEFLFKEAIAIGRRMLGPTHVNIGQWVNNLGNVYLNSGRFSEAEPCYREAISIGFKTLGRDSPKVATRVSNLAMVWQRQGRYRRAEAYFRIGINTCEKAYGRRNFLVASRLHKLAGLLTEIKRYDEAEPLYREAIAIGEELRGRDNFQVRSWMNDLGNLLRDTHRYPEAERLYRLALSYFVRATGQTHSIVAFTRQNLSELLLKTGRLKDALDEASAAVAIHEQLCGTTHKWTQGAAESLIKIEAALGRHGEAAYLRLHHGLQDYSVAQSS